MFRVKMVDGAILQTLDIRKEVAAEEMVLKIMNWLVEKENVWLQGASNTVMALASTMIIQAAALKFVDVEEGEMGTNDEFRKLIEENEKEIMKAIEGLLGIELVGTVGGSEERPG
jgi:hypothetical protein